MIKKHKIIIRLDDACPYMNKEKWERVEKILDKYNVKPIVGIIPQCEDEEFKKNPFIDDFWDNYALKWQEKKWIIAQHGFNHNLSAEVRTEFEYVSYEKQFKNLEKGYKILNKYGIKPICFFAPNHTFDNNTIKALNRFESIKFISDGYSIYPYKYKNMLFFPSVFDTPHKILPFGIWTFVYHPNNMLEFDFNYLEEFLKKNKSKFDIDLDNLIEKYKNRKRNFFDFILEKMIFIFRKVRNKNGK